MSKPQIKFRLNQNKSGSYDIESFRGTWKPGLTCADLELAKKQMTKLRKSGAAIEYNNLFRR